jgi:hypothetical protein
MIPDRDHAIRAAGCSSITVELPYPHKLLWPNGRTTSFRAKAAQVKEHRRWGFIAAAEAVGAKRVAFPADSLIPVHVVVSRKRGGPFPDKDNTVAAAKAYLDGIAERLKVNDRLFDTPTVEFAAPCTAQFVITIGSEPA